MPASSRGRCGFQSFVQWDGSDAWIGADEIHSRPSLCLSLECLNDTLKLMTWLRISFLLLLFAFALLVEDTQKHHCLACATYLMVSV